MSKRQIEDDVLREERPEGLLAFIVFDLEKLISGIYQGQVIA
jgi:hypothetical protein